jgi:transcriptional regulator with XRE-family HTH domain
MTLGERIKTCRQQAGMSQEKVAELVGISRQAVTKWETNQSAPSTENLFKLAEIFGTTVDLLLHEEASGEDTQAEAITEEQASFELNSLYKKKSFWIVFTVIATILLFLIWQTGQNVGEDIGEFIYNIKN